MIRLPRHGRHPSLLALVVVATFATAACTSVGPSSRAVRNAPTSSSVQGISLFDIDDALVKRLRSQDEKGFAETIGNARPVGAVVGAGDVLEVTIWEAPPAALFGITALQNASETGRSTALPEFLVGPSGRISIPFAGNVPVEGKTLPEIERDIVGRLRGKAHLPQVMVRLLRNATSTVTVIGDVATSLRMPLTPKGERLLDAVAAAGGTKQPINKMTVQVARGGVVQSASLEKIVRDPRQNITLRTDDVVTLLYQPFSFTVLGATGRNEEVNFEGTGLTLAQAMGRIGGLQDGRADAKGVFLFRWLDPSSLDAGMATPLSSPRPDGRVPVIFRANMKDPATYFAMQNFSVRNGDVLYVSNSPVADLQKFVGILASTIFPITALENSLNNN